MPSSSFRQPALPGVATAENGDVDVMGQVSRPGSLPLVNESPTLTDAVSRAGVIDETSTVADTSTIFHDINN